MARYAVISRCLRIATVVTVRVVPAGCVVGRARAGVAVRSDEADFPVAGEVTTTPAGHAR